MLKSIFAILLFISVSISVKSQAFVENKGQWPSTVLFAVEINGGMAFVENNGIVFNLYALGTDTIKEKNADGPHEHSFRNGKLKGHAFKLKFDQALLASNKSNIQEKAGKFNYFLSENPAHWAKNCNAYQSLDFKNVIDGIDLQLFADNNQLKWNFVTSQPNALEKLTWHYEGISAKINRDDNIVLKSAIGKIEESLPFSYISDSKEEIKVQYTSSYGSFGFQVIDQQKLQNKTLVIDPVLVFSTFSGSTADNFGYTATYDSEGFLYSGSSVFGAGYPTVLGAYDETYNGPSPSGNFRGTDIGISKFDTTGKFMIYSTYLGGGRDELPHSILANPNGELYVLGSTSSNNFPVTSGAFQKTFGGGTAVSVSGLGISYPTGADIIVSLLSADGSNLLASTYLGGSENDGFISYINGVQNPCIYNYADEVRGEIEFDRNGDIVVASSTYSTDFPFIGGNSFQKSNNGNTDGIIIKMDPNLDVQWATYIGGSGFDAAYSIQADINNNYLIAGGSNSTDLSFTQNGYQPDNAGGRIDGYIAKLTPDGFNVTQGTYWGSPYYDQTYFIDINKESEILVYGQTEDELGYFTQGGTKYVDANSGLFISKFDSTLSNLIWSSTVGNGNNVPNLSPTAFLSDVCDRIFISGWGGTTGRSSEYSGNKLGLTTGLNVSANAHQSTTDGSDVYFAIFDANMDSLLYGTFFGGPNSREHVDGGTSRFDKKGIIYQAVCAGCGRNSDFPIQPSDAHSPTNRSSNCNLGVFKFDPELKSLVANFKSDGPYCGTDSVIFKNLSENYEFVAWDFGDGSTSTDISPKHAYLTPGEYHVKLLVTNSESCNIVDSTVQTIVILPDDIVSGLDTLVCLGSKLELDFSKNVKFNADYRFTPSQNNPNEEFGRYSYTPTGPDTINVEFQLGSCYRSVDVTVNTIYFDPISIEDTVLCSAGMPITFKIDAKGYGNGYVWSNKPDFSIVLNGDLTDSNFTRNIDVSQTLYVKVFTDYCSFTDTVEVYLLNTVLSLDKTIVTCGESTVTLKPTINSNENGLSYNWTPGNLVQPDSTNLSVKVNTFDTMYYLTVSTANCSVTDSIFVDLADVLTDTLAIVINDSLSPRGSFDLGVLTSDSTRQVLWTPISLFSNPNKLEQKIFVFEDTYVYLQSFENGCSKMDSIFLKASKVVCGPPNIFVPTGFSPNGDGKNDKLLVRGQYIEELTFEVFDQWGQKVFETTDQSIGWDGVFKNKRLNPAVFVYQLSALCVNEIRYTEKGNITLIR